MPVQARNGSDRRSSTPHPKSETAEIARSGVKTASGICALGSAMLADIANSRIDHKEVVSYARGAGVMLGGARVGSMVGFSKDLTTGNDGEDGLLREEAELTARLEAIRERRGG